MERREGGRELGAGLSKSGAPLYRGPRARSATGTVAIGAKGRLAECALAKCTLAKCTLAKCALAKCARGASSAVERMTEHKRAR
jgi:hypothetical protein